MRIYAAWRKRRFKLKIAAKYVLKWKTGLAMKKSKFSKFKGKLAKAKKDGNEEKGEKVEKRKL